MPLEKPQPHPEKKPLSFEIFSPTQEEFETLSIEKLQALWRANHETLKILLRESHPPYFGWHGTNQRNFQNIKATRRCFVEIATFYEKEYDSEQFLYKLYHAALYVSCYANREQPGRIMVFHLEKDGRNTTIPWEQLKPGNSLPMILTCDSEEEQNHFSALGKAPDSSFGTDLLFRSEAPLQNQSFNEAFIDSINLNDDALQQYIPERYASDVQNYWRIIMRNRFLSQEIIVRTLKLLAERER